MLRRLLMSSVLLLACGDDSGVVPDSGPAPPPPDPPDAGGDLGPGAPETGPPRRDAGTALTAFSYTPAGCGYAVSTPEVTDGEMGADEGTGAPDHVHASFAGPASSGFAVNWRSEPGTRATHLLYGTDPAAVAAADGPAAGVSEQLGHTFTYDSILDDAPPTRVHEVHVCGLSAATRYHYKVGGPGAWSAVFDVVTAPETGSTQIVRFGVAGDSRNDPTVFAAIEQALSEQAVDFQLFSGDAVVLGASQPEWDEWFAATTGTTSVEGVLARIPFMPTNGNHESLAVNYLAQFALPQELYEGERGQGEEFYAFDYGSAHFVVLNDTTTDALIEEAQVAWMRRDLAAVDRARTPWVFVMHHRGTYSCSTGHGSDVSLRSVWQPLFDEFAVDIVFNGHDHVYERSRPIRGFQPGSTDGQLAEEGADAVPVAGSGTVYIVSGGAGAPLYGVDPSCYHTYLTESERNYSIVELEGRTLRLTAYRLNGSVLDSFTYTK